MYKYAFPHPIAIELGYNSITKDQGYKLRVQSYEYVKNNRSKGAQAANDDRQGYGILAEIVIRDSLNLPPIDKDPHPVAFDLKSRKGVKIDIKCRGGIKDFQEGYLGEDGFFRESKHNLFARQLYDTSLDSDIYVLTHLRTPKIKNLPGKIKERSWRLYVCGWISKKRALREALYIPPKGISEQGEGWLSYQYHNIEIYNKCLNGLNRLEDILSLELKDVREDEKKPFSLHMSGVDVYRIASDLIGRSILKKNILEFIKKEFKLTDKVKPILHPNQYFHLISWLIIKGQASASDLKNLQKQMKEIKFEGL